MLREQIELLRKDIEIMQHRYVTKLEYDATSSRLREDLDLLRETMQQELADLREEGRYERQKILAIVGILTGLVVGVSQFIIGLLQ